MTAIQSSPSATKKMGGRAEACRPKETDMLNVAQKEADAKPKVPPRGNHLAALKMKSTEQSIAEIIGDGGFKKLSASQAGFLYRECHYEMQNRDLLQGGKEHILVLADIMKRGEWRERDAIQFARLDGKFIIINGHHRLAAQEHAGVALEWVIVVYDCLDAGDVAKLYTKFDTNARVRSNTQVLGALNLSDEIGLSRAFIERVYSAIPLLAANLRTGLADRVPLISRAIDRRVEWLRHIAAEARLYENAIRKADSSLRSKLLVQGPVCVGLLTFKHCPDKAEVFWSGIAENDGLRRGDPRHAYVNAIRDIRRSHKGSAWLSVGLAATAWNAFYANRSLTQVRVTPGMQVRVLGTPLAKG